ncbi:MAG TPA: DUF3352 domain-containing protein [Gemmatimonadota bacterium]|nr:DUF3352 domain-containing protein [Gemmatimonadota bacterium]
MPRNPTPRRIGLVSFVAALLLSAGFAFACKRDSTSTEDAPQGIETRAVATGLPAGASVVVSGYDLQAFWTRLQGTQLYKELAAIQGVREAFSPIAGAQGEFEAETGLALDEATVMNLLGNKFDLGFYGPLPEDRADILLLAEVEDEAAARPIVEGLEGRIASERGATFSDVEVAGHTVRMAADAEGEEVLLYTLEDGRLVMSSTRARLEQVLGGGEESRTMADVQEYLDILEKLPEATITLWVDQRAIAEASRAAMEADTAAGEPGEGAGEQPMAAAASALEEYNLVRDFGVGIFWTDAGIRSDVFTRFLADRRPELAEMMTRPPTEVRSIAFQPMGTILYTAFNTLDPGLVYRQLTEYAVDATRIQMDVQGTADSMRADSLVRSNIAAFERETGLDIEEDILSWVGEEVSFSIAGVDRSGFFPVPEFAFAIASKDQGRANAFFQKFETLLADAARERASMPVSWQAEEHEGQTIRFAPTPVGEGLSISYVVTNDFALVASKPALVRQMLDARTGRAEALPSNPGFGALTDFYPQQVNGIGYVNLEELMTQIQGLMGTFGPMTGASPDSASTANLVLQALKNAPRLGAYAQAEGEGLRTHILLEVR